MSHVSSMTTVVETIEVDSRVLGNRDEFLFPQVKQFSLELDSPVVSLNLRSARYCSVSRKNISSQEKKPIVTTQ